MREQGEGLHRNNANKRFSPTVFAARTWYSTHTIARCCAGTGVGGIESFSTADPNRDLVKQSSNCTLIYFIQCDDYHKKGEYKNC